MAKSPLTPVEPPDKSSAREPLLKRLGWLVLIMAGGVITVAVVAYGLRKLLFLDV